MKTRRGCGWKNNGLSFRFIWPAKRSSRTILVYNDFMNLEFPEKTAARVKYTLFLLAILRQPIHLHLGEARNLIKISRLVQEVRVVRATNDIAVTSN